MRTQTFIYLYIFTAMLLSFIFRCDGRKYFCFDTSVIFVRFGIIGIIFENVVKRVKMRGFKNAAYVPPIVWTLYML